MEHANREATGNHPEDELTRLRAENSSLNQTVATLHRQIQELHRARELADQQRSVLIDAMSHVCSHLRHRAGGSQHNGSSEGQRTLMPSTPFELGPNLLDQMDALFGPQIGDQIGSRADRGGMLEFAAEDSDAARAVDGSTRTVGLSMDFSGFAAPGDQMALDGGDETIDPVVADFWAGGELALGFDHGLEFGLQWEGVNDGVQLDS
jgi:hypothetical protein